MDHVKYQEAVSKGSPIADPQLRFLENTLGLAGEAGEFADCVKKAIRDKVDNVEEMKQELGDVLWYVTSLAGLLGLTLADLAKLNYDKLSKRHPERYPNDPAN